MTRKPSENENLMKVPDRGRYRGALLGLATGDALGTTIEFRPPGSFDPVSDMIGGGPFALRPGEWTDDTAMALCLAESLAECSAFDARDQMERYVDWWRHGKFSVKGYCFDIGNTTQDALGQFLKTGEPFAGSTNPRSAGNGSLMRLAPVPLFFARDPAAAIAWSGESSRTTHGAATAVDACRFFGALIAGAVRGAGRDELLSGTFSPEPDTWTRHPLCPEIQAVAAGSYKRKNPPAIQGTGYVVQSLEAALWAFYHADNFRDGCLNAVNLGDDADTTGAVYGQLAGAFYGETGIPEEWRSQLAMGTEIVALADRLYERAWFQRQPH